MSDNTTHPWGNPLQTLTTIVLVLSAFLFVTSPKQRDTAKSDYPLPHKDYSANATTPQYVDNYLSPLFRFLGEPEPPSTQINAATTTASDDAHRDTLIEKLRPHLQCRVNRLDLYILLVADPKETQANYRYDAHLDATHKAMGAAGYVLDSHYLPWQADNKQDKSRISQPGSLLYRKVQKPQPPQNLQRDTAPNQAKPRKQDKLPQHRIDLALVFVVGETPTSGVNKTALEHAIATADKLRTVKPPHPRKQPLHIVGPIFSGSVDSLALAIARAHTKCGCTTKYRVVTGSATYFDRDRFKELSNSCAEIFSTIAVGTSTKDALIRYVKEHETPLRLPHTRTRIAWLTEFNTGYGRHSQPDPITTQDTSQAHDDFERYEFLFPPHLANLRALYSDSAAPPSVVKPIGHDRHRSALRNCSRPGE